MTPLSLAALLSQRGLTCVCVRDKQLVRYSAACLQARKILGIMRYHARGTPDEP